MSEFDEFISMCCSGQIANALNRSNHYAKLRGINGETALHYLAVEGCKNEVEILRRAGAEVDPVNDYGHTPLMECSQLGDLDMVKVLLSLGADQKLLSDDGTAMHLAARTGKWDVVKHLLLNGGDPDILDCTDASVRDIAERVGKGSIFLEPNTPTR